MQYNTELPLDLRKMLTGYTPEQDAVGLSDAQVYCYRSAADTLYLKVEKTNEEIRREHAVFLWLAEKLPVPEIRYYREYGGRSYLLTAAVRGHMAFTDEHGVLFTEHAKAVSALAEGLLQLQSVDIRNCPFDNRLQVKLQEARYRVDHGLVDTGDFEEDNPFTTAGELFAYLDQNRPPEELCFTHGDYCLPNVFIEGDRLTGFIDLGRAGIADKWQDIALCVRSLGYNLRDFGNKNYYVNLLFEKLGITIDEGKLRYYILLDDLF